MRKKRIVAAGLAVIMALTVAGCHQNAKEDTVETTVKENRKKTTEENKENTKEDAKKENPTENESGGQETADEEKNSQGTESEKTGSRKPRTLHPYIHTDRANGYVNGDDGSGQVSYEQFYYDYYGGTHGYNSYTGFTFDTKTGKKLDLYDVITDEKKVKAGIIQELKEKYASEEGLVENSTPEKDADVFFECINTPEYNISFMC